MTDLSSIILIVKLIFRQIDVKAHTIFARDRICYTRRNIWQHVQSRLSVYSHNIFLLQVQVATTNHHLHWNFFFTTRVVVLGGHSRLHRCRKQEESQELKFTVTRWETKGTESLSDRFKIFLYGAPLRTLWQTCEGEKMLTLYYLLHDCIVKK